MEGKFWKPGFSRKYKIKKGTDEAFGFFLLNIIIIPLNKNLSTDIFNDSITVNQIFINPFLVISVFSS